MRLDVYFFATLRAIVGAKTIEFEVEAGATLQSLLDAILDRFPALAEEVLDEKGVLSRRVHLMLNGRSAVYLDEGLATQLKGDETVDFFPAVAGG